MTAEFVRVEHLPTPKLAVQYTGDNGGDIAALFADPDLVDWDGWQLAVAIGDGPRGELFAANGDWICKDGNAVYPIPDAEFRRQYRIVEGWRS